MEEIIKKLIILLVASLLLCTRATITHASDSTSNTGVNFVIYGSINDTTLSGTITGEQSNGGYALVSGYYYDVYYDYVYAGSRSSSPYINFTLSMITYYGDAEPWKWAKGNATGYPRAGIPVSTRWMVN